MEDCNSVKTAVFFLSPFCGGAERMTINIAKLLDRKRYDVHFAVIGQKIGEIKEFIPKGYPFSLVKIRNIYDFTPLRVYQFLKKLNPQYVFCSLHYLNPRVIQAARWVRDCRIIIRFNCTAYQVTGWLKFLTIRTYPKADVIIAQTERMQEDITNDFHLPPEKVITLHNMLDNQTIEAKLQGAETPYPNNNTQKNIVWVGRVYKTKCLEIAVKAFVEAAKKDDALHLYVVGKYSEQDEYYRGIADSISASGVKDRIHFVGFQDNPYKWMKFADCFLLSSKSEGSPNVLFEALYLGIPSVSTRCTPNIDDIINDGENGYKVNVGDDTAMSSRLLDALKLKNVKSIYKHSEASDFTNLFE